MTPCLICAEPVAARSQPQSCWMCGRRNAGGTLQQLAGIIAARLYLHASTCAPAVPCDLQQRRSPITMTWPRGHCDRRHTTYSYPLLSSSGGLGAAWQHLAVERWTHTVPCHPCIWLAGCIAPAAHTTLWCRLRNNAGHHTGILQVR